MHVIVRNIIIVFTKVILAPSFFEAFFTFFNHGHLNFGGFTYFHVNDISYCLKEKEYQTHNLDLLT